MNSVEIINVFSDLFLSKKFNKFDQVSLLSEAFPTNFTPSGGEEHLNNILKSKVKHKSFFTVQNCFRYQDIKQIDSKFHLPFFKMGVAISINEMSLNNMTEAFMKLFKALNFDINKLSISIFKGEQIINTAIPEDLLAKRAWEKVGIKEHQFKYLDATENFFMLKSQGYAGIKTEAFYEYNGEQVEIGIIIHLTHEVVDSSSKLYLSPFKKNVLCFGIGLERLAMISQEKNSIFLIEDFNKLIDNRYSPQLIQIAVSILNLYNEGATVFGKSMGRVTIFRRLLRFYIKLAKVEKIDGLMEIMAEVNTKSENVLNQNKFIELRKEFNFILTQ